MGFLENLEEVGSGIGDLFTAPMGLFWDTAKAVTSDQYNPGFFGVWGPFLDRGFGGISKIGSGTGANDALAVIGASRVGGGLKSFWHEAELLYSTEYQRQTKQAPWGIRHLNPQAQPGDISIQRAAAMGSNYTLPALIRHPENLNVFDVEQTANFWRRAATQSPGQAQYENAWTNFYALSPEQREEVKASAHYQIFTGTVDAVARWYLSPDVILGKGLKHLRQAKFVFNAEKAIVRAGKSLRPQGLSAAAGNGIEGFRSIVLGAADRKRAVWSVVRSSQLEQMVDDGSFTLKRGMDSAIDEDEFVDLGDDIEDLGATQVTAEEVADELNKLGGTPESALEEIVYKGLDPDGNLPNDQVVAMLDEITRGVQEGVPQAGRDMVEALKKGGASLALRKFAEQEIRKASQSAALRRQSNLTVVGGTLGNTAERAAGASPRRWAGQQSRPVVLFASKEEAKRYASQLHLQDPTDAPVLLNTRAAGLDAIHEEYDLALTEVGGDAAFFTTMEKLQEHGTKIERLSIDDLDQVHDPPAHVNQRLYNQDGSAVEPDQVIPFDDMRMDFETAQRLDSVQAQKFLEAKNRQRSMGSGETFYDVALNSKIVHQVLNHIGRLGNADEIRRVFFPNHPLGQRIASDLAAVDTFAERRTVLAAYMGYRLPEIDLLPEYLRTKIEILHKEFEAVKMGNRPNEVYLTMVGEETRFSNLMEDPARMQQAFEEVLGELENKEAFATFLQNAVDRAPVQQVAVPYHRLVTNAIRRTSFYQESAWTRPIRVVVEMKPHRYMNTRDGMSDIQVVRQLEEAQKLGISRAEIQKIREEYMAVEGDAAKMAVVERAETLIIERAAKVAGLSKEQLQNAINKSQFGRKRVQQYLASRRYAPGGRDIIHGLDDETGEWTTRVMPLLDTQIQAWLPLQDVQAVISQTTRLRRISQRLGYLPETALDNFYAIWKPSVLLRGGWMIRVVSDEQLRILAKMGSMLNHLAAIEAGGKPAFPAIFPNLYRKVAGKEGALTGGEITASVGATVTGTRPLTWAAYQMSRAVTKGAEALHLLDPEYLRHVRLMEVENQVSARAAFGGPNETLLHEMSAMIGRTDSAILDHLRKKTTGQWQSVVRGSREYTPAWQRVLTRQVGQSPLGRKVTQDILSFTRGRRSSAFVSKLTEEEYAEVVRRFKHYLETDREGRAIANQLAWRSQNPERWAEDLIETINDYTANFDDALMEGILRRKVTAEMLEKVDETQRPDIVHAEIVDDTLGRGPIAEYINELTSGMFDLIGRLPTDTLSRQPFFKQLYASDMQRIGRLYAAQGVEFTEDAIQRASQSARAFAIQETKYLLYDLAEVSRFGDMMRFIFPFYSAWQEVIKVWSGLAFNDPSVIARGKILWEAPNRANMVYTDDEGQQFIQFRLSERMSDKLGLTGWAKYVAEGGARFGKKSFNLVLQSPLPSPGPLVQLGANDVAKRKPEFEAGLQWILPNGVSLNSLDILTSPLIKQVKSELEGPTSDASYVRAFIDAMTWMDVEYRTGRRDIPPTEEEAHQVAGKLRLIRMMTRLAAPVQPIMDSPLKPYSDAYRDMMDTLGPDAADEAFLNEYGEEFMAVTVSRTVSATGIPPTMEAQVARREYEDLIDDLEKRYPDEQFGRLILGDSAIGEFSMGAYAAQRQMPMDPSNPTSGPERTDRPIELDPRTNRIKEVDQRLGWMEFIKAMDLIELKRQELGLPNLQVKAAEGLAALKSQIIQGLAMKYPAWHDDYSKTDKNRWRNRIDALTRITQDKVLIETRADIQGLDMYLQLRKVVIAELNRRGQMGGSKTIDATSNMDLADWWATIVSQLVQDNIAFQPLYYRYLEGDTLEIGN